MIDATNENKILEAKNELHRLINEEELRTTILAVVFNQISMESKNLDSSSIKISKMETKEVEIKYQFSYSFIKLKIN